MSGDQRAMLTKRLLKEAFIDLIKDGHYDNLSVKGLCEKAGINRTTFYYHYNDAFGILQEIQDEIRVELENVLNSLTYYDEKQLDEFYHKLFRFFEKNNGICKFLLNYAIEGSFVESILSSAYAKCEQAILQHYSGSERCTKENVRHFFTFASNGYIGMIKAWLNNGMIETPKEISEICKGIATNGLKYIAR